MSARSVVIFGPKDMVEAFLTEALEQVRRDGETYLPEIQADGDDAALDLKFDSNDTDGADILFVDYP